MTEAKKLEQTRSKFKLRGIVNRIGNDKAHRTGETGSGNDYQSIRFGVKTSELNEITVELFGMVVPEFKAYHKDKDNNSSVDVKWEKRNNLPEGFLLPFYSAISTGFAFDDKGKVKRKSLMPYDAVTEIMDNLQDGDSVYVGGDIEFSTYESQGETKHQTKYIIKSISKQKKEIDFEDEKFKEMNAFETNFVYISSEKVDKNLEVIGRTINFKEEFTDNTFVIDTEKFKKMALNVKKKFKFGDLVTVKGYVWNKALTTTVEDDGDEWGENPSGYEAISGYLSQLEITKVDSETLEDGKGKYTEADFESNDIDPFSDENSGDDPFSTSDDPFKSDDEDDWS